MKKIPKLAYQLVLIIISGVLTACASAGSTPAKEEVDHEAHHPAGSSTSPTPGPGPKAGKPGTSGSSGMPGAAGMGMMGMMDPRSMCDMHASMMSSSSPGEKKALRDEHMKSMSPEEQRQHMQMMDDRCR